MQFFFVGKEEELLIDLIELSGENPHACAFAFCEPDAVSVTAVSRALQYGNTMFVLSDQDRYSNSITAVEAMLNGRGVLYGTYRIMEEFCPMMPFEMDLMMPIMKILFF
jgi:hypothetical protein